jgi:ligand-binding sensor domain-containing protein
LWVGDFGGELRRFNKKTGLFSQPYVLNNQSLGDKSYWGLDAINTIYKDRTGTLWVGTKAGIHKLSLTPTKAGTPSRVRFQQYQHNPKNPNSLSSNNVTSIFSGPKRPALDWDLKSWPEPV